MPVLGNLRSWEDLLRMERGITSSQSPLSYQIIGGILMSGYPQIRVWLECANPKCEASANFELIRKRAVVEKHLTTYEITYRCRTCGTEKTVGVVVK
jgi:aspartate carbamoyltransferase regulatory subunit